MFRLGLFWIAITMTGACAASAAPATVSPFPHYELIVTVDQPAHRMIVEGSVDVPRGRANVQQLDLKISGTAGNIEWSSGTPGVAITAIRRTVEAEQGASNPSARRGASIWNIRADWQARTNLKLKFKYELTTPEPSGFIYIGPEIAFAAGGWYPEIDGVRATSELTIRAAPSTVISSAGLSQLPPRQVREGNQETFNSSVPGELFFAVSPAGTQSLSLSPSLTLRTLKPRPTDAGWRQGLRATASALEGVFGPLPYQHITVVEVPDVIADKAGFGAFAASGAVIARTQLIEQPFNVAAFSHEFAHLWWGNYVVLEGAEGDFLLDEGLAQYGSMAAIDRVLGAAAGARYRRQGAPGFNESLYSALGYLQINAAGMDRPLLALGDDGLSYWIAYSKAGLVWYALAEEMGADKFSAALREVVAQHGAGSVSWTEVMAALQRQSARPLRPFITAWFATSNVPDYRITWSQRANAATSVVIEQRGAIKPANLEVEVMFAHGRVETHRIRITGRSARVVLPTRQKVRTLVLDPQYRIVRWTPELRTEATALAGLMRASILARLGRKDEAERVLLAELDQPRSANTFDRLLLTHATLARLTRDRGCSACVIRHIEAALALKPARPERLAVTYLALAQQAVGVNRIDLAQRAARAASEADTLVGNANGVTAKLAAFMS